MSQGLAKVLLTMHHGSRVGMGNLGRLQLVKLAYIEEILSPVYQVWGDDVNFVRYLYGPYSDELAHAFDFMVFHGLATPRSKGYEILPSGRDAANEIGGSFPKLDALCRDVVQAFHTLNLKTGKDACRVVYAEPAFAAELARRPLPPGGGLPKAKRLRGVFHSSGHPSFDVQLMVHRLLLEREYHGSSLLEHVSLGFLLALDRVSHGA